jgi:hypothetical protein
MGKAAGVVVNQRRPEEFQHPGKFNQLQQPDGLQRIVFLPHNHRHYRGEKAHRHCLCNVQAE